MVDHNPAYNIEYPAVFAEWDQILSQSNYTEMINNILMWTGWTAGTFDNANLMWNVYGTVIFIFCVCSLAQSWGLCCVDGCYR